MGRRLEYEVKTSVRLNMSNPQHVKINDVIQNLDPKIFKSKNQFIIDAIQFYIDNYGKETFVIKKKEKERAEYIRSEDIDGTYVVVESKTPHNMKRKALGNKRNDISEEDIAEITKIYGDFKESEISQIYNNEDFGYTKITIERPLRDEEGNLVLKKGKKQPDTSLRDTENVPLKEDIKEYFEREVLPFAPDAWIDEKKSKVGYEIPFTRYFYKYETPRPSAEIMAEIMDLETELSGSLEEVFDL